jgi:hypothetical protein
MLTTYEGTFYIELQSNINVPSVSRLGKWTEYKFTMESRPSATCSKNPFVLEYGLAGAASRETMVIHIIPYSLRRRPLTNG